MSSNGILLHRCRSTLAQVMACCHQATSHYLNQCWFLFSEVPQHSPLDLGQMLIFHYLSSCHLHLTSDALGSLYSLWDLPRWPYLSNSLTRLTPLLCDVINSVCARMAVPCGILCSSICVNTTLGWLYCGGYNCMFESGSHNAVFIVMQTLHIKQ